MFRKKTIISSKKQKALKNIGWALCGKIVNLMGMLIVGIIVARYLGKEQYGIMNYVISIVTIAYLRISRMLNLKCPDLQAVLKILLQCRLQLTKKL